MNGKMKIGILILALVAFFGCEEFYTFNLFGGLDPVIIKDLNEMSSAEGLEYLGEEIYNQSFVTTLEEDPVALVEVNDYLANLYTTSTEPAEVQEAAILAADLQLNTTGGSDMVGNIWGAIDAVTAMNSGGTSDSNSVEAVVAGIIPESVETVEDMQALLEGFFAADAAYTALNDSVGTNGTDTAADVTISGGTVMNAVVTTMIVEMVNSDMIIGGTQDEKIANAAIVFLAISNGEEPSPSLFDSGANFAIDPLNDAGYASNLADAAGLDLSSMLGGA
jgi:hypothetical protein